MPRAKLAGPAPASQLQADLVRGMRAGLAAEGSWKLTAHPSQVAPEEGTWKYIWFMRGSRASGKTYAGSHHLADMIIASPPGEWAIVAPWLADCRDTCMESRTSGLIAALGGKIAGGRLVDAGPRIKSYNRNLGQLYLLNGSVVYMDGANDGALNIQGKNLSGAWLDEIGLWRKWELAYSESVKFAVRKRPGKIIITGTPKWNMPARKLVKQLLNDPNVAKSWLHIENNLDNLEPNVINDLMSLRGTRLGRQEIGGELLEDVENALWMMDEIDALRVDEVPELSRVVIAIDPAVSSNESSDETGIVVMGLGDDGHGYVLADLSGRYTPTAWAQRAVDAYREFAASLIVAEVNNGGDMVGRTLQSVDMNVPYRQIRATRGKVLRAEPVSVAYEQGRVHHVGFFEELESQMCLCALGQDQLHDDRLDAMVYASSELGIIGAGISWDQVYAGEQQIELMDDENPWMKVYG